MLDNDNIMTVKASKVDKKDYHKCYLCVIVSI